MSENARSTPAPPAVANVVTPAEPGREPTAEPRMFPADYVRELREEAKSWRQKAEGHRLAADEARKSADAARAGAEKAALDARENADRRVVQAELRLEARLAGMIDPDGLKLLDASAVTLGPDGEVAIPDGFFDAARRARPWLFVGANTASTASPPAAAEEGKTAARMSAEELRAFERQHGIRR